jgi:hypothetical protein
MEKLYVSSDVFQDYRNGVIMPIVEKLRKALDFEIIEDKRLSYGMFCAIPKSRMLEALSKVYIKDSN